MISNSDSCDSTHINKHIKKDTPLSDVPSYNIVFIYKSLELILYGYYTS